MRRVLLSQIEPGMVLGRSIYNERGDRLLAAGVELEPRLVASLERRGIMSLLVVDDLSGDIIIEEVVTERVRSITIGRLHTTFDVLQRASADVRGADARTVAGEIHSVRFGHAVRASRMFDELWAAVEEIVNDVLAAENLSGLVDLQSYDDYTFGHSVDMAATAVMLGRLIHLDLRSLHQLALGSLLHDVGKVFLDEAVLSKPRPLTADERAQVEQHPAWGYELMKSEDWGDVLTRHVVYQHHERQDGNGYPRGLTGSNRVYRTMREELDGRRIFLLAEVAAVADVYDAICSDRPYRAAMPHERAIGLLRELAGTQLNKELVTYFLNVTPVFPPGTEVGITSGPYEGFRALVVQVPEKALDRPIIRVFADAGNRRIDPFDVDLREALDISLSSVETQSLAA